MDWTQVFVIVVSNIGIMIPLFLWIRSEANSDRREHAAERSSDRREIMSLISAIHEEIKDFHGRLCSIEKGKK
jgi:formate-dependent nitrite reductase membrane component NrfD